MTDAQEHEFDPRLLELHLGHLSAAEQAELHHALQTDPRLAAQDEALAGVFEALAAAAHERAPADLAGRVLKRVAALRTPPRVVRPADELTEAVERQSERVIRLGTLREIVAIAAVIVLAVGIGVPGLMHVRDRNQRMGCSWNLAQLGLGVQQYASTFNASLPFAGWSAASSWQPSAVPGVQNVPNRRHVYPLLRYAYVADARLFVCPSRGGVPMPREAIQRYDDFIEGRNVTYAYQNMAGVRPATTDDPRLPIMADENPLFDDGRPLFDPGRLAGVSPAEMNSAAHARAGQNVLTLAGEVRWVRTPLAGVDDDNIWTLMGVQRYTGQEGPQTATDAHLLK